MSELGTSTTEQIRIYCAEGYSSYDSANYNEALALFNKAWQLIPEPQLSYRESGWVLTAIGDAYFKNKQFKKAKLALKAALHCPGINQNPFVLLRLGQAFFELGNSDKAHQTLARAFKKGGRHLFIDEPPRYLMAALQPI